MRATSSRAIGRLPETSKIPTMPHMAVLALGCLRKSCPLQRRALGLPCFTRLAQGRQCDACSAECALVDAIVGGDHGREAEPRRYEAVRRLRMPVSRGSVIEIGEHGGRERI